MLDLFGNHIVGFPTRRLNCYLLILEYLSCSSLLDFFPRRTNIICSGGFRGGSDGLFEPPLLDQIISFLWGNL